MYISSLASNESSGNSRSSNTSDDPRNPTFKFPATNLAMAYEKHNEAVKKKFGNHNKKNNNDRLLVFNPTQGWDPLCNFLNVEKESCPSVEDEPFPRMTDRQMMMVMSKVAMVITCVFWWPIMVLFMMYCFYSFRKRRHKKVRLRKESINKRK